MVYINTEIKDFKPQLSIDVWLRMKLLQFLKMKLAVVMNRFHPAHCLVHLSIGRLVRLSSCTFLMFADGFFSCPNAWLAFSDCTCPLASHLIEQPCNWAFLFSFLVYDVVETGKNSYIFFHRYRIVSFFQTNYSLPKEMGEIW